MYLKIYVINIDHFLYKYMEKNVRHLTTNCKLFNKNPCVNAVEHTEVNRPSNHLHLIITVIVRG